LREEQRLAEFVHAEISNHLLSLVAYHDLLLSTKMHLPLLLTFLSHGLDYDQRTFQSLVRDLDAIINKLNTTFQEEMKQQIQKATA